MTVVFDSCAWIEFFLGSDKGEKVRDIIMSEEDIITPSIVLAEVANKYYREGVGEEIIKQRLNDITTISLIRYIDIDVLSKLGEAREIMLSNLKKRSIKSKPSLADYLVYAVSLVEEAMIVTGDEHFNGLKNVIYLK